MREFLEAVMHPSVPMVRYTVIAGILASVPFGMIGTIVVARRISYIAGAISHSVLGGIGAAIFLQKRMHIEWIQPMHGAVVAALISALTIGLISMYARQREDTVIGALWAIGMAAGLIFLQQTPGHQSDPMSYLFGDILMIQRHDLSLIVLLDITVVALSILFYNKFLAVCFDEEFARLRGVKVEVYYLLLLCLTAMTIVLLVSVVGIVMVIALLVLPAAVAGHFARRLWQMMLLAIVFCLVFTVTGIACSYSWNLPTGPTIILIAGAAYLTVATVSHFCKTLLNRRNQNQP